MPYLKQLGAGQIVYDDGQGNAYDENGNYIPYVVDTTVYGGSTGGGQLPIIETPSGPTPTTMPQYLPPIGVTVAPASAVAGLPWWGWGILALVALGGLNKGRSGAPKGWP